MKKLIAWLIAFFSWFLPNKKMATVTIHGMKVRKKSREARILASTHDVVAPRPNGVKMFNIGNQIVWALNMKNAIRKAALYPDREIIGG